MNAQTRIVTVKGPRYVRAYSSLRRPLVITETVGSHGGRMPYTLTHAPTGRAVLRCASLADARLALRTLLPLVDWMAVDASGLGWARPGEQRRVRAAVRRLLKTGRAELAPDQVLP